MVRVLALIADPEYGGQRIHERFGWDDPFAGVQQAIQDLNLGLAGSGVSYSIEVQEVPIPPFGYRSSQTHISEINTSEPVFLSPAEWVQQWMLLGWNPDRWPGGGNLHVKWFLENHVLPRIGDGIDEIWLAGLPMPMAFEGGMLAPEWDLAAPRVGTPAPAVPSPTISCNLALPKGMGEWGPIDLLKAYRTHDTLVNVPGIDKRYVWHMFQASNFNPIHNYIHRCEAILNHVWGSGWNGYQEQWSGPVAPGNLRSYNELFGNTDNTFPGLGMVGSCHFLVNAKGGYWYDTDDVVPSGAHLFKDFPTGFPLPLATIDAKMRLVSRKDWAGLHDPLIWWLQQLPRNEGKTDSRWNNWIKYVVDTNDETGRGMPATPPTVGPMPKLPGVFTRYGNRTLVRWPPNDGDGPEQTYSLLTDDVPAATLRRRGSQHSKLSMDVPIGRKYTIRADSPNKWERSYDDPLPPPPTPGPEEPMIGLQQTKDIISEMHRTLPELANCLPPEQWIQQGVWYYAQWPSKQGLSWGVDGMNYGPATVRAKYLEFHLIPTNHTALCAGTPTPLPVPPAPTPGVPEPEGGYPSRPASALYSPQELWAGVYALHAPGGRMASCPRPNRMAVNSSSDYVLFWDQFQEQRSLSEAVALTMALASYEGPIYEGLRRHCSGVTPPPGPGPIPTPTPTPGGGATLKDIARVKVMALRAELAIWEREL